MEFKQIGTSPSKDKIQAFATEIGVTDVMSQILLQRGVDTKQKFFEYTNASLEKLRDPFLISQMDLCYDRIKLAIEKNESVLIYGDYDVDGISASAILHKFLKDKITNLNCFLPNRYEDGYGLTVDSAKKVIDMFHPNLIITVDCGIASVDEVEYIKSQGVDIIITDHHEPQQVIPNTIVVDPKIPNQSYGFDGLCGAGVAMKVVETFVGRENLTEYLPICAIATVADIVPLVDENRTIVKLGSKLSEFLPEGLKILIKHLKIDELTSQTISFKLAPKLNATGRMGDAFYSLNLYISSDKDTINTSIKMVDELNAKRQQLSQTIYDECVEIIKKNRLYTQKAIIIKSDKWDSGLLGIACARLVDEFYKPVFLFSEVDDELKGSVRSIDSINIHTVLSCCNTFLDTFGGHSMAAGLGLKSIHYDEFKNQIFDYLDKNTTDEIYQPIKYYDIEVRPEQVTIELAKEIAILEPMGCENPIPVFLTTYTNCFATKTQKKSPHLNIIASNCLKLIAFNSDKDIDDYQFARTKKTLFEVQTFEYKKKLYLKGIVKKTLFYGYDYALQNIGSGRQLKQFVGKNYYGDIHYFEGEQLKELLKQKLSVHSGTAIIIYNSETFEKLKSLLLDYQLNYYVGGSQSKFEENCVVFALEDIKSVENYKTIIFVETLLDTAFLGGYVGNVYAQKNQQVKIDKLFLTRDNFGVIYKAILMVINSKIDYSNEIEFYNLLRKMNPHLSRLNYSQFVASMYTFLELGMIKLDKEDYLFSVDNTVKSKLENSKLYNKLNFLSKIR